MLKGAEVIFGERYGLVMHCSRHCLHSSSLLYNIQGVPKKTKTIEITNNNLIVRI